MAIQSGNAFNGPLKYRAHTLFPTGVNSVGGTAAQKAKYPFLSGIPIEAADALTLLPYQTPDDQPRVFGYAWNASAFPFSYATGTVVQGVTPTLTASSTTGTNTLGGSVTMTTSAGAPAINQYISGAFFAVTAGKKMWYEQRFNLGTVTSTAYLAGFVNSGYAPATLATLPTDGIFIVKPLASTDFTGTVRASSTSTSVTGGLLANVGDAVLANNVFVDIGILVDSGSDSGLLTNQGAVSFYVNGKFAGQVSGTDPNLPPSTTVLCYYFAIQTTGGAQSAVITQGLGMEEL